MAYKMITDLGGVRAIEDAENSESNSRLQKTTFKAIWSCSKPVSAIFVHF
jgi:hypothetical protein